MHQFTVVAVSSSVALRAPDSSHPVWISAHHPLACAVPLLFSMAVMDTVAYVTQKPVHVQVHERDERESNGTNDVFSCLQTGFAMSRIFPFVSCCIVFTCARPQSLAHAKLTTDEASALIDPLGTLTGLLERPSLGVRYVGTTVSNVSCARTSGTKQSISHPSLHDRPSQQLHDVAVLSAEYPPCRLDDALKEGTGGCEAPRDKKFGSNPHTPPLTGPGASAQPARAIRGERRSSDETKDEADDEQISLRGLLAPSPV